MASPGKVDPVRAREALTRARVGGVAEAEAELAALPSNAFDNEALDESGTAAPEEPVSLELADLESARGSELENVADATEFESVAEAPILESVAEPIDRPVSVVSTPYLSLVPTEPAIARRRADTVL